MDLAKIVRKGVAIADKSSNSLQPQVSIERWLGSDEFGKDSYDSPLLVDALIVQKQQPHFMDNGESVSTKAYIAILRPLPPLEIERRIDPIDAKDKVTLPDGTTGPIVDATGFVDKGTGRPFFSEIWIGK